VCLIDGVRVEIGRSRWLDHDRAEQAVVDQITEPGTRV
jgi:hypothetical protein